METFSALLAFCAGSSPVNSPHKGQWRIALMFSFIICALTKGCVKNRDAGDLRRRRAHYDVTVTLQSGDTTVLPQAIDAGYITVTSDKRHGYNHWQCWLLGEKFLFPLITKITSNIITITVWKHQLNPIPRPNGRAMVCILWGLWGTLTALYDIALYRASTQ